MEFPQSFKDQMLQEVILNAPPRRIISLVPSQTELLFDLGLDEEVVGITKFCIHPESWFRKKTRIGGTKQFDFGKIETLQPDLIIGNKEENEEQQIRRLQKQYPVWMSDIKDLSGALEMIRSIGDLTNRSERASEICTSIANGFDELRTSLATVRSRKVAYLIWKDPYMAAGADTFIDAMLRNLQLENIFRQGRYPETTLTELQHLQPELMLLSSEPYPFKQKHLDEIQSALPDTRVLLVDGEMFSWYGSRLLKSPQYFRELTNQFP